MQGIGMGMVEGMGVVDGMEEVDGMVVAVRGTEEVEGVVTVSRCIMHTCTCSCNMQIGFRVHTRCMQTMYVRDLYATIFLIIEASVAL